jgi:hypothetical protein
MQELIRLVINRTGLSHEHATIVVKLTLDFIRMKLPADVAAEIDTALRSPESSRELRIYLGDILEKK